METAQLKVQGQSDADAALARRLQAIYKRSGGLGAFFDRLQSVRREQNPETVATRFCPSLAQAATGGK